MSERLARASRVPSSSLAIAAACLAAAVLGGCAPDAMRNYQATGFNGYLNTLKTACPNMMIGSNTIGLWLEYNAVNDNYNYWLDMTSRLYYRRLSVAEYQASVAAQLGGSSSDGAAFDCIVRNLPAQR